MKKLLTALLALALCLTGTVLAGAEEDLHIYQLGETIEDFTVTALGGQTVTLSELLKEKDMVLLNLWATWCGPCEAEFPAMEAAYEQYQDKVAVVALSTEPEDTEEILAEYAASHGMTFAVGWLGAPKSRAVGTSSSSLSNSSVNSSSISSSTISSSTRSSTPS